VGEVFEDQSPPLVIKTFGKRKSSQIKREKTTDFLQI
jgi:hypothetical protein